MSWENKQAVSGMFQLTKLNQSHFMLCSNHLLTAHLPDTTLCTSLHADIRMYKTHWWHFSSLLNPKVWVPGSFTQYKLSIVTCHPHLILFINYCSCNITLFVIGTCYSFTCDVIYSCRLSGVYHFSPVCLSFVHLAINVSVKAYITYWQASSVC